MDNQSVRKLKRSEMKHQWRDIIELDIQDPKLKAHVTGFLNYFEGHAFKYQEMNVDTKKTTDKEISGQDILNSIASIKSAYDSGNFTKGFTDKGFMKNGKFFIAQHDRLYDGRAVNGSNTASFKPDGSLPIKIEIGTDYLKGAKFVDNEGQKRPVTVDGVIAHELAHFAYRTNDEPFAGIFENIISSAMGGYQRNNTPYVNFERNGNGGYMTLYDKVGKGMTLSFNSQSFGLNNLNPPRQEQILSAAPKPEAMPAPT